MNILLVSAHERVQEGRFKGGAHTDDPRYKTKPCKEWDANAGAFCPRGARCDFAHGPVEMRSSGRVEEVWLGAWAIREGGAGSSVAPWASVSSSGAGAKAAL